MPGLRIDRVKRFPHNPPPQKTDTHVEKAPDNDESLPNTRPDAPHTTEIFLVNH